MDGLLVLLPSSQQCSLFCFPAVRCYAVHNGGGLVSASVHHLAILAIRSFSSVVPCALAGLLVLLSTTQQCCAAPYGGFIYQCISVTRPNRMKDTAPSVSSSSGVQWMVVERHRLIRVEGTDRAPPSSRLALLAICSASTQQAHNSVHRPIRMENIHRVCPPPSSAAPHKVVVGDRVV
jgi:hypothetical protein